MSDSDCALETSKFSGRSIVSNRWLAALCLLVLGVPVVGIAGAPSAVGECPLDDRGTLFLNHAPEDYPVPAFVQNDSQHGIQSDTRSGDRKDPFFRMWTDSNGEVRTWYLPGDGSTLEGDPALLSRLWWQASPFEIASGSSGSYLGIGVADVTKGMAAKLGLDEVRGVVVTAVAEGSPAEKAGIKVKDVVVSYNGSRLESRQQLTRMVAETPAERTISLSILRGGAPQEVKLTTAARRMNPELRIIRNGSAPGRNLFILPDLPRMVSIFRSPMLGIESEALNSQMANFFGVKEGVLVREVIPESPAAIAGVKAGDVIVSFAGEKVASPSDITSILRAKATQKDGLVLMVVRNQKKLTLTITPSGDWTEGRYFPDDTSDGTWSRK